MSNTPSRAGRPAVGPMISLRLPAELIEDLDQRAEQVGSTRSELIRRAAERLLAQQADMVVATAAHPDGVPRTGWNAQVGDQVAVWRRIAVSGSVTVARWYIGPASLATDGPHGPAHGDPAGFSVHTVGFGHGTIHDVYVRGDEQYYVVELDTKKQS